MTAHVAEGTVDDLAAGPVLFESRPGGLDDDVAAGGRRRGAAVVLRGQRLALGETRVAVDGLGDHRVPAVGAAAAGTTEARVLVHSEVRVRRGEAAAAERALARLTQRADLVALLDLVPGLDRDGVEVGVHRRVHVPVAEVVVDVHALAVVRPARRAPAGVEHRTVGCGDHRLTLAVVGVVGQVQVERVPVVGAGRVAGATVQAGAARRPVATEQEHVLARLERQRKIRRRMAARPRRPTGSWRTGTPRQAGP